MARISRVLVLFVIFQIHAHAQENRYIVYFSDKDNSEYSVENPGEFLSARSIERRQKQGIEIIAGDLPVNTNYVESLNELGYNPYYPSKWLNAVLIEILPDQIAEVVALPFVTEIELAAPGKKKNSGGRKNTSTQVADVKLANDDQLAIHGIDQFHLNGEFGQNSIITVLDAGFNGVNTATGFSHLFNDDKLIMAYNFVSEDENIFQFSSHGTVVLSTLAGNIPEDYVGVTPQSSYLLFVTEDVSSEYRIEEYLWAIGAEKADSVGTDVINSSLGYYEFDDPAMNYTYDDMDGHSTLVSRAATLASDKGIVVVAANGNERTNDWHYMIAPADAEGVLAVGAISADTVPATFSSVGPTSDGRVKPDVVAIGVNTVVINSTGAIGTTSGTSLASPVIAGYAALVWGHNPGLSALQVRDLIRNSGHLAANPENELGYGIPFTDVVVSLEDFANQAGLYVYPNPATTHLNVTLGTDKGQPTDITILDVAGRRYLEIVGSHSRNIDITSLNPGVFILIISIEGHPTYLRFIKQ